MNKLLYTLSLFCFFFSNAAISQTVDLTGKVLRHNGQLVEGVTVSCTGANDIITASDGVFAFEELPEGMDYAISGTHETDAFEGITILDALFLRNMLLFIPDVTIFQTYAGDINHSGGMTTIDLVEMFKAVVKIDNGTIPSVYWHFFDGSNEIALIPGITLANVNEDVSGLELVATKKGDVALEADHMPAPPGVSNPHYYIPDTSGLENSEITLDIRVEDFKDIAGFQHGISWDPEILEFIAYENSDFVNLLTNEAFTSEGMCLIAAGVFEDTTNMAFEDGSAIYSLRFNVLSSFETLDFVEFSEAQIPLQTVHRADDGLLYVVEDSYEVGITTSNNEIQSLELFEISPNPAQQYVNVNIKFENQEEVELTLLDISGRVLEIWNLETAGYQYNIEVGHLPNGTYLLKLQTNNGVITKKLVKH